jgi:hypothetical protein
VHTGACGVNMPLYQVAVESASEDHPSFKVDDSSCFPAAQAGFSAKPAASQRSISTAASEWAFGTPVLQCLP